MIDFGSPIVESQVCIRDRDLFAKSVIFLFLWSINFFASGDTVPLVALNASNVAFSRADESTGFNGFDYMLSADGLLLSYPGGGDFDGLAI